MTQIVSQVTLGAQTFRINRKKGGHESTARLHFFRLLTVVVFSATPFSHIAQSALSIYSSVSVVYSASVFFLPELDFKKCAIPWGGVS